MARALVIALRLLVATVRVDKGSRQAASCARTLQHGPPVTRFPPVDCRFDDSTFDESLEDAARGLVTRWWSETRDDVSMIGDVDRHSSHDKTKDAAEVVLQVSYANGSHGQNVAKLVIRNEATVTHALIPCRTPRGLPRVPHWCGG